MLLPMYVLNCIVCNMLVVDYTLTNEQFQQLFEPFTCIATNDGSQLSTVHVECPLDRSQV